MLSFKLSFFKNEYLKTNNKEVLNDNMKLKYLFWKIKIFTCNIACTKAYITCPSLFVIANPFSTRTIGELKIHIHTHVLDSIEGFGFIY